MSESQTIPSAINGFRVTAISFACVLGSLAIWILAAEVVRPSNIEFATNSQSDALYDVMPLLWLPELALCVETYGPKLHLPMLTCLGPKTRCARADVAPFEQTKAITEQAIARAPHNSRLWLLLAANYFHFDRAQRKGHGRFENVVLYRIKYDRTSTTASIIGDSEPCTKR